MDRTFVAREPVIPGPCTKIRGTELGNAIEYTESMVSRVCFETKRSARLLWPPRSLRMRACTIAVHSDLMFCALSEETRASKVSASGKAKGFQSAPEHSDWFAFWWIVLCFGFRLRFVPWGPMEPFQKKVFLFFKKKTKQKNQKPKTKKQKNKKQNNKRTKKQNKTKEQKKRKPKAEKEKRKKTKNENGVWSSVP